MMNGTFRVDVIIPVYKPDSRFQSLLRRLQQQTYPIERVIIMNTERFYWKEEDYQLLENLEVYHVTKEDFDHGRTRNEGASHSDSDIMIFMTDDAVPADKYLVERLVKAFDKQGPGGEIVAEVYGRQIPAKSCRLVERFNREFNYPDKSRIKTKKDLETLGIKTYFASNACCAYRKDIFEKQGGFITRTIFNEDMIYGAGVIQAGYAIAYEAQARVIHSHNLSFRQQLSRNFDLAVSQADHPEVFQNIPSEGEGIRMVKETAKKLITSGHGGQILDLVFGSGCKYVGYWLGKRYKHLPMWMVRHVTSNQEYWNKEGRNRP